MQQSVAASFDVEKGASEAYGTFTHASKMKMEAGDTAPGHQGLISPIWLSLGASLAIVATFALCAFVLVSAFLG